MYTPSYVFLVACSNILPKKIEKRVGAKTQPCFTPVDIMKGFDKSLLYYTCPRFPSCSCITMDTNLGGKPSFSKIFLIPVLLTESKALVR